jgi:Pyruvate/2-oxoacid:ferredoxin oxidoreductase delta subunit
MKDEKHESLCFVSVKSVWQHEVKTVQKYACWLCHVCVFFCLSACAEHNFMKFYKVRLSEICLNIQLLFEIV